MLNGKFKGEIQSCGAVMGNVLAADRIELQGPAWVFGDIEAPVVVVEGRRGLEGHCRMTTAHPSEGRAPREGLDLSVVNLKRSPTVSPLRGEGLS